MGSHTHTHTHTHTHIYKSSSLLPSLWHFGLFYEVRNGKPSKRFRSHTDVTQTLFSAVNFHSSSHRKRQRNRFTVVRALETSSVLNVEVCVKAVEMCVCVCLRCDFSLSNVFFNLLLRGLLSWPERIKKSPVFKLKKSHFGLFHKRWNWMDPI